MVYYHSIYDGNRGGNNYLASDMSVSDDILVDFAPSNLNSKVKG